MALLNILQYPDSRLKKRAELVEISDVMSGKIQSMLDDMLETMYQAEGVGLAAIQVNIPLRIIVIDVSTTQSDPIFVINPEIEPIGKEILSKEGCLSFPGIYAKVKRYETIKVTYLDRDGNTQQLVAQDLLSICLQHELDHLNGLTFLDRLSPVKRLLLEKKLATLRSRNY